MGEIKCPICSSLVNYLIVKRMEYVTYTADVDLEEPDPYCWSLYDDEVIDTSDTRFLCPDCNSEINPEDIENQINRVANLKSNY